MPNKENEMETLRDRLQKTKEGSAPVKKFTVEDTRSAAEKVAVRASRTLVAVKGHEERIRKGFRINVENFPAYLRGVADVLANQVRDIRDIADKLEKGVEIVPDEEDD